MKKITFDERIHWVDFLCIDLNKPLIRCIVPLMLEAYRLGKEKGDELDIKDVTAWAHNKMVKKFKDYGLHVIDTTSTRRSKEEIQRMIEEKYEEIERRLKWSV